ncbi:Secreted RxLR effector peptide protein [Phytophthora palmivora]|uniref:Secreted RxLR effector peptide protein n=1 Tax=Phytophthora palmivora TaxID=4796 RepID=A0A2P4X259_9STRA|nr:Secreted RxLR effector peptide protein [Phytophthora palmivora]
MRLYLVALLVTGAFLVNVERATSFQQTTPHYPTVIIRSITDHQNSVAPKRLLRHYREDDEERTIGGGTISELATKLKGGVSNLAKKFVGINKYEDQIAKTLDPVVYNALTTSGLSKLTSDVEKINSNNLIKKVSVIGILTTRYGDDGLAKALVTAKQKAGDPVLALQIQALRKDQMTRWLKGGNSVDDVFNLLKIRDDRFHMIASRKLEVLDDYIKFVNPQKYDQTSLAKTLIKTYGSEDNVLKLLAAGKHHGHTANLLEDSLLSKWAGEGQLPANVFQWLKLYNNVNDAFTADHLNKIAKYVDDFYRKDRVNQRSALTIYTNSFGDATVAKELALAARNPLASKVAKELQTQQLQGWIASRLSVDDVFNILKIKKEKGASSWQLDVLEKFISRKSGEQSVIKILTEKFGGNNLALILERASKHRKTSTSSKLTKASALQEKQFAALVDDNIRPDNFMSYLFKTSITSATKEQNEIAAKFAKVYKFISRKSGEHNVIKTLTEQFGGNRNLATILERTSKSRDATILQKQQFI